MGFPSERQCSAWSSQLFPPEPQERNKGCWKDQKWPVVREWCIFNFLFSWPIKADKQQCWERMTSKSNGTEALDGQKRSKWFGVLSLQWMLVEPHREGDRAAFTSWQSLNMVTPSPIGLTWARIKGHSHFMSWIDRRKGVPKTTDFLNSVWKNNSLDTRFGYFPNGMVTPVVALMKFGACHFRMGIITYVWVVG